VSSAEERLGIETMDEDRRRRIDAVIQRDPFACLLGAEVEVVAPGHSRVTLTITEQMANFHGSTHGGVIFSLGDLAFAAASNSRGQTAVALNVAINFLQPSRPGDCLIAEAVETSANGPVALYAVTVKNERTGDLIAKSEDLAYRKKHWFLPEKDSG
jgi:acyl-CoA thioesterase